jgi:hypothetical protein
MMMDSTPSQIRVSTPYALRNTLYRHTLYRDTFPFYALRPTQHFVPPSPFAPTPLSIPYP